TLDQVLAERRRVGRAAARTGDDDARRTALEAGGELGYGGCQQGRLAPHGLRRRADLRRHPGFALVHAHLFIRPPAPPPPPPPSAGRHPAPPPWARRDAAGWWRRSSAPRTVQGRP